MTSAWNDLNRSARDLPSPREISAGTFLPEGLTLAPEQWPTWQLYVAGRRGPVHSQQKNNERAPSW